MINILIIIIFKNKNVITKLFINYCLKVNVFKFNHQTYIVCIYVDFIFLEIKSSCAIKNHYCGI